jgi:glycosyltransferase EpsD
MKKVLFVATVVKLHIMVFHIPYLEWFKKNGYEVHVAARNDYENKEECSIPFCDKFFDLPFERSPFKKNNLYVQKKLKKIIDTNEYEIIHCHTPMGGALGRLAAREARKNGTKVIYTAHGFHFYKGAPIVNWLVYYPVERWLARYTDILITINKEDYERAKDFTAMRIEYVPGVGIDTYKFNNIEVDKEKKRKSIGIIDDDFMIISVGELNKNKNHQVIIRAIAKLKNKKIKYVLCGQGPLENKLKKLAQELNVERQVKFLGFRKDIPELMHVADLFAFPSFREGLSLSLMEAMASGLPVVCSKIRGNVDLIKHEKGGYLEEATNLIQISNSISKLYDNKILRDMYAKFNKHLIEKYSINSVINKVTRLYKER